MAQLLRRAADQQKLVMLTLKSRKIYCCRIFEVSPDISSAEACVDILPSFSAYLDKDTLKIGITLLAVTKALSLAIACNRPQPPPLPVSAYRSHSLQ